MIQTKQQQKLYKKKNECAQAATDTESECTLVQCVHHAQQPMRTYRIASEQTELKKKRIK